MKKYTFSILIEKDEDGDGDMSKLLLINAVEMRNS